ncbi:hypothetical protein CK203_073538 [Vitis vinifera]|uniref:Uncharacterized protein n=1 Tax=Vitis vinifera TaxID=29760 RepID=A0A438DTS9_VITVI|nr:hypothetical protein CK203_073538 [Vitis vinifera]
MNSKPFLLLCLLLAAVLLTSSAASAKISIDEKNVEAADQQVNQVAHASTQGVAGMDQVMLLTEEGVSLRVWVAKMAVVLGVLVKYAEGAALVQKKLSTTRKLRIPCQLGTEP